MLTSEIKQFIQEVPAKLDRGGLYPSPILIEGPTTSSVVCIDGRSVLQFGSGNYLGLAHNPAAIESAIAGLREFGLTSSGSRLVCGSQAPQRELEREIARFQCTEDAVLYFLVTSASEGVLGAIMRSIWAGKYLDDLNISPVAGEKEVFVDQHSHPSLTNACAMVVPGVRNLNARVTIYKHNDIDGLEQKLIKSTSTVKLIATDGIFSADADLCHLPELVTLAKRHQAMLFVDDAHGTGVLGETGQGIWQHFGLQNEDVDFKVGSLAKAFAGGLGGFLACSGDMARYMRFSGGPYMFSGSIPPAMALAITSNIRTAQAEPWRRTKVLKNAHYARTKLRERGFKVLGDETPIVPVLIGDDLATAAVHHELLNRGIYVPEFRYPARFRGHGTIRATMTALHTEEQINTLVHSLDVIAARYHVPRV